MSSLILKFWVIFGLGVGIGHHGMCWPLGNRPNQPQHNMELGAMDKLCQEADNITVYEEVLNMCVSCTTCRLDSQDDHCHTCRALGLILGGPAPVVDNMEVGDLRIDTDRDLPIVNMADKMDDAERDIAPDFKHGAKEDSSSDMGLSVGLIIGVGCVVVSTVTIVAVGVTLFKRKNGMLPVPRHDDAAADQSKPRPPQQETNPPDDVHPSNALTYIKELDQIWGRETTV